METQLCPLDIVFFVTKLFIGVMQAVEEQESPRLIIFLSLYL